MCLLLTMSPWGISKWGIIWILITCEFTLMCPTEKQHCLQEAEQAAILAKGIRHLADYGKPSSCILSLSHCTVRSNRTLVQCFRNLSKGKALEETYFTVVVKAVAILPGAPKRHRTTPVVGITSRTNCSKAPSDQKPRV